MFRYHMREWEILMRLQLTRECVYHKHVSENTKTSGKFERATIECIFEYLVKGIKIRPDPLPYRNDKRRDFCSRYDGYGDFCSGKYAIVHRLFF
jgi:hypothetical protein